MILFSSLAQRRNERLEKKNPALQTTVLFVAVKCKIDLSIMIW